MNMVILKGNVGQDVEIKTLGAKETKLATTTLATTDGFGDNKKTNWHNIKLFGKTAEAFAQMVTKGQQVLLSGRIEYESWEKDGAKQYRTSIIADHWEFCGSRDGGSKKEETSEAPAERSTGGDDSILPF